MRKKSNFPVHATYITLSSKREAERVGARAIDYRGDGVVAVQGRRRAAEDRRSADPDGVMAQRSPTEKHLRLSTTLLIAGVEQTTSRLNPVHSELYERNAISTRKKSREIVEYGRFFPQVVASRPRHYVSSHGVNVLPLLAL